MQPVDGAGGRSVPNAFRHQRKERTQDRPGLLKKGFLCSTPFGINGRNCPSELIRSAFCLVLNAFRHQRKESLRLPS